ncbi:MAG: putative toxin-antitoxin system toxin component, PIN family, partial [Betaproteobacteria bacterium]
MNVPFRAVLDTNVVLSALVFRGGTAGQLRLAWQRGLVLPLASTATVQELVRVLAYPKFRLSQAEQDELLADYLPYAETVRIPQPPPTVPECRDALDLPFMHLAVAGKAQFLVSGDRDLLAIAAKFERICSCSIV